MRWIDERIEFWETVYKYANKTVKKNNAKKHLELLWMIKEEVDRELEDFYEYQIKVIDQVDEVIRTTLK